MVKTTASQTPESELFRETFDASPIGIAVETLDGQPLFVNPALCAMLGFTEGELRSKHCQDFSPPEDAQKDLALFRQLRAGSIDHYQLEKRYFRGNGSLMWGRLNLSLLSGRVSPLVLAMVEDITEQKKAQDALTEQTVLLQSREELLRIFVKNAPAGVAMFDRDMHYLQVSDRWCADYSVDSSQILGHSHYEFFLTCPIGGKKCIAVVLREKHCERKKTAGIAKAERSGFGGKSVLGGVSAGCPAGFSSSRKTSPSASIWKRNSPM